MKSTYSAVPLPANQLLRAELPFHPPSVNRSYKIVLVPTKGGEMKHRLAATPELEQFKATAGWLLTQCQRNWSAIEEARKNKPGLAVDIHFYYADARRRDVDGNIKALLDAVFAFMTLDDSLVVDLRARKTIGHSHPRCEIIVGLAEMGG